MRLIGQAIAHYSLDNVTAVGVCPWGAIVQREELEARSGERTSSPAQMDGEEEGGSEVGGTSVMGTVEYTGHRVQNSPQGAALEPHHSHFILADNGQVGNKAWGREVALRFAFEKKVCDRYAVPMVLVVVNGGPITLKTVREFLVGGCPVLLLLGSGGAADAIAECFALLPLEAPKDGPAAPSAPATDPEAQRRGLLLWDEEQADEAAQQVELEQRFDAKRDDLREIMLHAGGGRRAGRPLLFAFDACGEDSFEHELDEQLLQAVLKGRFIAPRGKLTLAVTWNNDAVVRELLLTNNADLTQDDLLLALRVAMTQVPDAELNFEVVSLLLAHPKTNIAKFAFSLLPLGGDAAGDPLEWCDALAELLPPAWEYRQTLAPTEAPNHPRPDFENDGEEQQDGGQTDDELARGASDHHGRTGVS